MTYAIISVGGKQYRVHEGERLLVDRVATEEGATFTPAVLLVGGDGDPQLSPDGVTVTARVVAAERGPKIRIGKYRKRTGYRRHTGFRSALSRIEIESIAAKKPRAAKPRPEAAESAAETPEAPAKAPRQRAAKPKAEQAAVTAPASAAPEKPRARATKAKVAAEDASPAATGDAPEKPRATRPRKKTTEEEG